MKAAGIPTIFSGWRFRSRLEAKWAAFFEACGWAYEYEPFDMKGYIPDFVLKCHNPVLVDIRPIMTGRELAERSQELFSRFGGETTSEILALGAFPMSLGCCAPFEAIGVFEDRSFGGNGCATLHRCTHCERVSFHHCTGSYACRVNGCHDGDHYLGGNMGRDPDEMWKSACNSVQWMAR